MKTQEHINQIHIKLQFNENKSNQNHFTNQAVADYPLPVVAKSTASRRKLNHLPLANSSTPILQRAFFVRSTRTPKENALGVILSMVERIGQSLRLTAFPMVAGSYPDTLYRQAVGSQAVDNKKLPLELLAMIYKFLCLNRTKPTYNQETIYIEADSEENARFKLTADYRLLLNRPIAKLNPNRTACEVQGGVYA
ncbi:host cell division inhibitor Icd-like protein [Ursidibacter sp. B-7004-1]